MDFSTQPGASILQLCNFLFEQYEHDPGVLAMHRVSGELEQTIVSAVLLGQPNNYTDAFQARSNRIEPKHVRKVTRYIEEHLQGDISIEELVVIAGCSARALYSGFERFVGMPPLTFIRNRRLEGARRELQGTDGQLTVAQVATKWNFTHFGRFSTEYRRRFGERPSDTLKQ
jgi:AraC-like DNA-binding protein